MSAPANLVNCHLSWTWPTTYTAFAIFIYVNNQLFLQSIVQEGDAPSKTIQLVKGKKYHIEVVATDHSHINSMNPRSSNSAAVDVIAPI